MGIVDSERAKESKDRKVRKRGKRAVARARRVASEGLGPEELSCPSCGACPGDDCRTPGGRLLGGYRKDHASRRREAEAYTRRILEARCRALDRLAAGDQDRNPNTLSLKRVRRTLGSVSIDLNPIHDRYRFLIEDLYADPTPKKWGLCSGIVLAPDPGFGLTLWKALLAVDPDNTPLHGPIFGIEEKCQWGWAPGQAKILAALEYAASPDGGGGPADRERPGGDASEDTPQPALW